MQIYSKQQRNERNKKSVNYNNTKKYKRKEKLTNRKRIKY